MKPKALDKRTINSNLGSKAGSIIVPPNAIPPRYFLFSYRDAEVKEEELPNYDALLEKLRSTPDFKHWIDIRGYADSDMLYRLSEDFNIHSLKIEDVLHDFQRPKVEGDEQQLFIVTRMLMLDDNLEIDDDQLSLFTGPNYVLTLQSDYIDCLEPIRNRLRSSKGRMLQKPAIFLAYTILDIIIDHYFLVLAELGESLDDLEDDVLEKPTRDTLNQLLRIKRELIKFRRVMWPERDKLSELLRLDPELMPDEVKPYLRDVYDHAVQLIDLTESYKDLSANLTDLYMSSVSNRMNEVMKVLTIISSIFIPLSFVASLYGMNFSLVNEHGEKTNPLNMPELYSPYGYVGVLAFMLLVFVLQITYFYRKGWFSSDIVRRPRKRPHRIISKLLS
jgi:magnesium transporter